MRFPLTLATVAEVVGGEAFGDAKFAGVVVDSRQPVSGQLYLALKGATHDGHRFVGDAWRGGASAALVSDPAAVPEGMPFVRVDDTLKGLGRLARWTRDQFDGPVVGITGSVGKTSTKELVATVLGAGFVVHSTAGNRNNEIGVPTTILSASKNTSLLVLEMGMRGLGQIKQLCEIARPTIGVVTGIGVSHIELLGSQEAIADAKSEIFEGLASDGTAIFPASDAFASRLRSASSHCRQLTVGVECPADVTASELFRQPDGWRFTVDSPWGRTKCFLPSPARFLVANALFAMAVAGLSGMELVSAARALARYQTLPGRLHPRLATCGASVIDDTYNAAPESMESALDVLAQSPVGPGGSRIAVLGEMRELGEFAIEGHAKVGRVVARLSPDMLILVGDGARRIESSARIDGYDASRIHWFASASEAASLLPSVVTPPDVILAKGSRAVGLEAVVDALCGPDRGSES